MPQCEDAFRIFAPRNRQCASTTFESAVFFQELLHEWMFQSEQRELFIFLRGISVARDPKRWIAIRLYLKECVRDVDALSAFPGYRSMKVTDQPRHRLTPVVDLLVFVKAEPLQVLKEFQYDLSCGAGIVDRNL